MSKRVSAAPSLVYKDGLLVHRGKLPNHLKWDRLVSNERNARPRKTFKFATSPTHPTPPPTL